jgi:hypothetical protein
MNAQRYEILTLSGTYYENVWQSDGEPETFDSVADAEAALAEHLRDCWLEVAAGHLSDAPTREQFVIAPYVGSVNA